MQQRRTWWVAAAVCVALAVIGGSVRSAQAAYPGSVNGRLAFGMTDANGTTENVYSIHANGNGLRQLTHSAFNVCAAYSADGKHIAYCSNNSGPFEIWAMNANGSHQRQVTHLGGSLIFPDWSPSGKKIAAGGTIGSDTVDQILVFNSSNGKHVRALTNESQGNNDFPAWSPNGRKIAFISDRTGIEQVWVMNCDGSHQHALTTALVTHDEVPDWSPNGKKIVFQVGDVGSGEIWVMNANGSDQHQISSGPGDKFGPTWSPRGDRIAFVADFGNGNRPVEVMNADGSDVTTPLPGHNEYVPAWQPRN